MAAELGDHDVAGGDLHIVDAGPAAARDLPRGRDQPVAELARPDEGDVALRGDARSLWVLQAKAKAESASVKMKPPWAMRWPLTISGRTVIESVARPDPISTISMPRPLLASSSFHIASAQARARSSGESVALTFTAALPVVGLVATSLIDAFRLRGARTGAGNDSVHTWS